MPLAWKVRWGHLVIRLFVSPLATKCNIGKNLKVLHFDSAPPPGACNVTEVLATLTKMNW